MDRLSRAGRGFSRTIVLLLFLLGSLTPPVSVEAACPGGRGGSSALFRPVVERLVADGMDPSKVASLFARREVCFDPKVMPLKLTRKESTLDYGRFLRPERLAVARRFMAQNLELLKEVEGRFGVPKEVKVAILLVETNMGSYTGKKGTFNILASMAAASDISVVEDYLPPALLEDEAMVEGLRKRLKRKSAWAYQELKALVRYCDLRGIDPLSVKGSIFGAVGICQFMPSNILRYGVDFDGDGVVDLFSKGDALASMANYLKEHGWRPGLSPEEQYRVILKYNYSRPYAETVLAVARRLKEDPRYAEAPGAPN